jgi:endonuclease/exonuclease/phosphatase family metal-dependent hydrolase
MLTVELEGLKVNLINLHLHHSVEDESIRVHQIWSVLKWIEYNTGKDDLTIMLGDFNAEPETKTYQTILDKGYVSSHLRVHNCEPINTFHNRIEAPYKDASADGTFDYIFVKENKNSKLDWNIKAVSIHGQEESTVDKGIYASDHYALVAEFVIG